MTLRPALLLVMLVAVLLTTATLATQSQVSSLAGTETGRATIAEYLIAAAARVEPASEEIDLGAPMTGLLKEVTVREGDSIHKNQILAIIENAEYEAELARAEAVLRLKRAELRRTTNGARQAERDEALAAATAAEAVLNNSASELERRRKMLSGNAIPLEELEQANRDYIVAKARHAAALQRHALVNDPPREEDVAIAQAEVAAAEAARDAAKAVLEKTRIRSPIDGIVLRVHRHPGELLTTFTDMPIMTIGDLSHLYVRADVDEIDIGRLRTGQRAYVMADAFGEERFWGRVVRIGRLVGKKNFHTDEPTERLDTRVLETLIELESPNPLVAGLRVDAFILPEFMRDETVLRSVP